MLLSPNIGRTRLRVVVHYDRGIKVSDRGFGWRFCAVTKLCVNRSDDPDSAVSFPIRADCLGRITDVNALGIVLRVSSVRKIWAAAALPSPIFQIGFGRDGWSGQPVSILLLNLFRINRSNSRPSRSPVDDLERSSSFGFVKNANSPMRIDARPRLIAFSSDTLMLESAWAVGPGWEVCRRLFGSDWTHGQHVSAFVASVASHRIKSITVAQARPWVLALGPVDISPWWFISKERRERVNEENFQNLLCFPEDLFDLSDSSFRRNRTFLLEIDSIPRRWQGRLAANELGIVVKADRIKYWLGVGVQPSDTVAGILHKR
ncbi:hypothetical protein R1flu_002242 [Riccia fluitans]|uniref:Uncharacterized protein n=1 Tax=Riccia fluitans TaxID=41844 RepID=A0ABD1Y8X0_9MARC